MPPRLDQPAGKGWRFWAVLTSLALGNLLVGLDVTIQSSALPSITDDLNAGENYIWIQNGYLLTMTAFLPLYGQLAQVLGRRWPTMVAVSIFLLGSGINGGASSTAMLIAGRLVQGIGAAGMTAMTQLIITDLVSMRDRGKYIGFVFAIFGVGSALGPPIGGVIVQYISWRWVFYINLPIAGLTLAMQFLFLQVAFVRRTSIRQKLRSLDWVGNAIIVAAVVSILIALSWANTRYPWSSWRIIVPLVLGFVGLGIFAAWESSPYCIQPTIPPKMFANRTSAAALIITFLMSMLTIWRFYFLPVYFQAVKLTSSSRSGVLLLPSVLIGVPAAIISGQVLSRVGRYKPIHFFGFATVTLASGLYIYLGLDSSLAEIVIFQLIAGIGGGCLMTTLLPAVQAPHPPMLMPAATSTWTFIRAFGNIWGIAIPSAIFNVQFNARADTISDPTVRAYLGGGEAYAHISAKYIRSLTPEVQHEVREAYLHALKIVWIVCTAFCGLGLALIFLEKEIELRRVVEGNVKLKEKQKQQDAEKLMNANKETAAASEAGVNSPAPGQTQEKV
ncbi:MFS general substrate transporter [Aspergillus heteromorphus CBS 117.55]|uniref:MFS general substrate transporter n=1 Tax=Aspergillus heteromorphus CBS 117.55 TaxID=1448321 RepID=A0A317VC81_9EURO|nr:MFS general substrate transporter [Aspergillus heteromorphus CBS 117.55]PWY71019.1 MFS general substrate transporter [Aspergillus heteromorphus CBS 117.55]